ncbi:MAG: pyridoxal phosphate-dependent aminotransferase [Leptolyngbyaceae cyanobacterium]
MAHPPAAMPFDHEQIRIDLLRERAFNLRWASVDPGVIPLTAADPDFPCAPEIADAIARYARGRYLSYAPAEGLSFFREAISAYYHENRAVPYDAAHCIACDSAAFGIYAVCKAYLQPGEEAIVFNPVDFLFKHCVERVGAHARLFEVPLDLYQTVNWQPLEDMIQPATKLICLCNPLNPTGKVFSKDELMGLAAIAEKHNVMILSDEIWSDIVFAPYRYLSIASIPEAAERTIIVTGFSKSYGLAGLRAGAILTPSAEHFNRVLEASGHQSTVHGCNVLAQVAATAALQEAQYWLYGFVSHLHRMRDITVEALNQMPGITCMSPQGCYVAFANVKGTGFSAEQIQEQWLRESGVAVVPGSPRWFGSKAEHHIRISFATSAEILHEAFQRIQNKSWA